MERREIRHDEPFIYFNMVTIILYLRVLKKNLNKVQSGIPIGLQNKKCAKIKLKQTIYHPKISESTIMKYKNKY